MISVVITRPIFRDVTVTKDDPTIAVNLHTHDDNYGVLNLIFPSPEIAVGELERILHEVRKKGGLL